MQFLENVDVNKFYSIDSFKTSFFVIVVIFFENDFCHDFKFCIFVFECIDEKIVKKTTFFQKISTIVINSSSFFFSSFFKVMNYCLSQTIIVHIHLNVLITSRLDVFFVIFVSFLFSTRVEIDYRLIDIVICDLIVVSISRAIS